MACIECGRIRGENERFSYRGKCRPCSVALMLGNNNSAFTDEREAVLQYRRGMAASVGAIIIEDIPDYVSVEFNVKIGGDTNADS